MSLDNQQVVLNIRFKIKPGKKRNSVPSYLR